MVIEIIEGVFCIAYPTLDVGEATVPCPPPPVSAGHARQAVVPLQCGGATVLPPE